MSESSEGLPLLRLGFRPFYLLATAAGALLPLVWIGLLTGALYWQPALPGTLWHGHEMVFGFVVAAIIGFLFTAGRLWTGFPTPTGAFLAALALLWLCARLAALTGPYALFLILDAAFLPLASAVFFRIVNLWPRFDRQSRNGVGCHETRNPSRINDLGHLVKLVWTSWDALKL
jgi:uncharacterized protein involved in response to NO